ncbi:unnamed protein product [Calicophoron daubneyi]|uniref:PDZ domain-containing protein n=1 Tax=Calicophoron daubneyi TaxID=300641 RepID=A0AAV2SZ87_CALDB
MEIGKHQVGSGTPQIVSEPRVLEKSDSVSRTAKCTPAPADDFPDSRARTKLKDSRSSNFGDDGCCCEVDALTLARDGGILDWDDKVIDVLDDRELLIAHFHMKATTSNTSSDQSSPLSFGGMGSGRVRCNGEDRSSSVEASPNSENSANPNSQSNSQLLSDLSQLTNRAQVKELVDKLNRDRLHERNTLAALTTAPVIAVTGLSESSLASTHAACHPPSISQSVPTLPTACQSTSNVFSSLPSVPPPPPPLRFPKQVQLASDGQEQSKEGSDGTGATSSISTFRASGLRANRPAPPPPPLASAAAAAHVVPPHPPNRATIDTSTSPEVNRVGTLDIGMVDFAGIRSDLSEKVNVTDLTGRPAPTDVSRLICSHFKSISSCVPQSTAGQHTCTVSHLPQPSCYSAVCSIPPPIAAPIRLIYPLSPLPPPPVPTASGFGADYDLTLDQSILSTVPEEDTDHCSNSEGRRTVSPPPFPPCVTSNTTVGTVTTSTASPPTSFPLPSKLSISLPKLAYSERDYFHQSPPCDNNSAQFARTEQAPSFLLNFGPSSLTSDGLSGDQVLSATCPRPNRKVKRRRVPRPPPPPPPVPPPLYSSCDSPAGSRSSTCSEGDESAGGLHTYETSTVCRRPLRTAPDSSLGDQGGSAELKSGRRLMEQGTEAKKKSVAGVFKEDAGELSSIPPSTVNGTPGTAQSLQSTSPLNFLSPKQNLPVHWTTPADFIPGYSLQELAEAERSMNAENTSPKERSGKHERQFSLEEDHLLAMKPAPPKRSPFTTLTGLSFLSSLKKEGDEAFDRKTGGSGAGRGGCHSDDDIGNGEGVVMGAGSSESSQGVRAADGYASPHSSDTTNDREGDRSSLTPEEDSEETRRRDAAAEDEVLHMTELLSKRRESEARRHLMMAELEADMERDHRLRAAATAMALAAVSNISPARKARANRYDAHGHYGRATHHHIHGSHQHPTSAHSAHHREMLTEEDFAIAITKTSAGLGFSLTTRPLVRPQAGSSDRTSGSGINQTEEPTAIYVKNILPGGAALKDGQLRLGDRLIRVDDQEVAGKTQAQIVQMLRVKPVGSVVKLVIRRTLSVYDPKKSTSGCPVCLTYSSGPVKPCSENCPFAVVGSPSSLAHRQQHQHQQLPTDVTSISQRIHSHSPFCHTLSASKLQRSSLQSRQQSSERPTFRCASPTLPHRGSSIFDNLSDTPSTLDYPPFSDVLIFRLDIPLFSTPTSIPTPSTTAVSTPSTTSGHSHTVSSTTSRHMRLGVSVRETSSSRVAKMEEQRLSEPSERSARLDRFSTDRRNEVCGCESVTDSIYGGVLVKGVIEGGAAHKDGRLRIGDELLEVNGVPLVNAINPLSLLRSVLRQLTSPSAERTKSESANEDQITRVAGSSQGVKDKTPVPVVELLIARQTHHRRSASGHTLASNSEFWTETSSTGTTMTRTTCVSASQHHPLQGGGVVNTSPVHSDHGGGGEETSSSSHAVQIAADVHSEVVENEPGVPDESGSTEKPSQSSAASSNQITTVVSRPPAKTTPAATQPHPPVSTSSVNVPSTKPC